MQIEGEVCVEIQDHFPLHNCDVATLEPTLGEL